MTDPRGCRAAASMVVTRIDSLAAAARRAGERGDIAALRAVSDTMDSLKQVADTSCRADAGGRR